MHARLHPLLTHTPFTLSSPCLAGLAVWLSGTCPASAPSADGSGSCERSILLWRPMPFQKRKMHQSSPVACAPHPRPSHLPISRPQCEALVAPPANSHHRNPAAWQARCPSIISHLLLCQLHVLATAYPVPTGPHFKSRRRVSAHFVLVVIAKKKKSVFRFPVISRTVPLPK
ncbi:hypothetical protein EJ04DRAFT_513396 [Polyplosphaeria fusca]|uniref:Secreted protein n=1 Tax=Polyplosphaeria fusca TaxID=682080 RepID=A0A9P4QYF6_9PLEO|nr:hypothetical protein EJ04DRAFT_513396 [Polyplosphaeria fusca]